MFVINANQNGNNADYVSASTFQVCKGYFNMFWGMGKPNYSFSCYGTLNQQYHIGSFYFATYDIPVYADSYYHGCIGGCGTRGEDSNSASGFSLTCARYNSTLTFDYKKLYSIVSRCNFEGGEIVGKNILFNNTFTLIGKFRCNTAETLSGCIDVKLGLVSVDGTYRNYCTFTFNTGAICQCACVVGGNIPDINNGDGITAQKGDRVAIVVCGCAVGGGTPCRANYGAFLFGTPRIGQIGYGFPYGNTTCCSYSSGGTYGLSVTNSESSRAFPMQISIN